MSQNNFNLSPEITKLLASALMNAAVKHSDNQKKVNFYDYDYPNGGHDTVEINNNNTIIHWGDGTVTSTVKSQDDTNDVELAILICVAKKFAKGLNLDKLFKVSKDSKGMKEILKQMIISLPDGREIYNDFIDSADYEKSRLERTELRENREKKRLEKRKKRFAKIEQLKKDGKWVPKSELLKLEEENRQLKRKLEQKEREKSIATRYEELKAENEKLSKELEG